MSPLSQQLHHVLRQVTPGQVHTKHRVGQSVPLVDRHSVRHTITAVHHHSGGTTRRIQRQHSLDLHVHRRHVEGLEHDLGHALTIRLRVQRSFSQQHRMLLRGDPQLIIKRMRPNLLHVVPVRHNPMFNRIFQSQDSSLALCFIPHIAVLVVHPDHDPLHLRSTHDGRKHRPRRIITSESSLAHPGPVVHNQSGNLILGHGELKS
mmetsp:Transcript_19678/g.43652  ORF Transcript_19678/g.43652 Transcript_19678/m.43652 type:complete len:205 (+) Transcript_19678:666-1280(+)